MACRKLSMVNFPEFYIGVDGASKKADQHPYLSFTGVNALNRCNTSLIRSPFDANQRTRFDTPLFVCVHNLYQTLFSHKPRRWMTEV